MHDLRRTTTSSASMRALLPAIALDFTVLGLVLPILPLAARRDGLSVIGTGGLFALYAIAQLLAGPAWGRYANKAGRRPVLLAALIGTFIATALIALSHDAAMLFLAVLINGVTGSAVVVAQTAVGDVVGPDDYAQSMAMISGFIALGFVLGPALAGITSLVNDRLPFLVAAVFAGINAVFVFVRFPETLSYARGLIDQATPSRRPALSRPDRMRVRQALAHTLLAFGCMTAVFSVLETTFGLVGARQFGFGQVGTGLSFALLGIVWALTQARGVAIIVESFGRKWALRIGSLFFALGLIGVGATHSLAVMCLGVLCIGIGYGIMSPLCIAAMTSLLALIRSSSASQQQQSIGSLARIVGPIVGAMLLTIGGSFPTYFIAAIGIVGAMILGASAETRFETPAFGVKTDQLTVRR